MGGNQVNPILDEGGMVGEVYCRVYADQLETVLLGAVEDSFLFRAALWIPPGCAMGIEIASDDYLRMTVEKVKNSK